MTRRAALIGHPLKRRHSEIMHNAAFEHFSIDARYELHEMQQNDIPAFATEARSPGWYGFQVTAPYKQFIMGHLDEIESGAREIGAVNSVLRREDGSLVGFNTDAPGFQRAAEGELAIRFSGLRVGVAGAGGVARAVVHALVSAGADSVTICDIEPSRAEDLAADLRQDPDHQPIPLAVVPRMRCPAGRRLHDPPEPAADEHEAGRGGGLAGHARAGVLLEHGVDGGVHHADLFELLVDGAQHVHHAEHAQGVEGRYL